MLLVQKFLYTLFLFVQNSSLTQMVHKKENKLFSVPKILTSQHLDPELQHCSWPNSTSLATLRDMSLENKTFLIHYYKNQNYEYICLLS